MQFKLISFDMFLTLARLEDIYRPTWELVLGRPVTEDELARYNQVLGEGYLPQYLDLPNHPFRSMEEVFAEGFEHVRRTLDLPIDPAFAARVFCEEHDTVGYYDDVAETLERLSGRYDLAVSTDADENMVSRLIGLLPVRYAFVSGKLRCYKADRDRRFFGTLLRETGLAPGEVLHVGDGSPDIVGASASGVKTCLIARGDRPFGKLGQTADYRIRSLRELDELLK